MAISVPERFVLLDGIRGVAALFIVHRHAELFFGRPEESSYLAVDLFFALSGFVLAHAYGKKLADGTTSPATFMTARFFRLYPLYVLSLLLMAAFFVCLYVLGLPTPIDDLHRPINLSELGVVLLTGLLFLPAPFTITLNGALFLVSPAWSLFNELVVNTFYARWGVRASLRFILCVVFFSLCLLVVAAIEFGKLHAGFRWHEMYAGMGRVFFSFLVGMLIYRFRDHVPKIAPFSALLYLAFVCLVLALPISRAARPFYDLAMVVVGWPVLLYLASRTVPDKIVGALSSFLGTASYAVYVLHIPLLAWTVFLLPSLTQGKTASLYGYAFIAAVVVLSWALTVWYDQPLQAWLKKRLRARATSRQTA